MKLILAICFSMIACLAFSQTTEEEYNYVSKGYKIQLESGLDMKKGYRFENVDSWGLDYGAFQREASFKYLYRDGEDIPCATMMKLYRTDTDYEQYLCIPHYNSSEDIWKRTLQDFKSATEDWTKASHGYAWGMIKMISFMSSKED